MPDQIADEVEQSDLMGEPEPSEEEQTAAAIAALMERVAFEPQDVQDQMVLLFEWLADKYRSDHWKLSDRQARVLGTPTAQFLNALWAKLLIVLPDVISRWCLDTPGATAFLMACGIVVGPKIAKQWQISRERRKAQGPRVIKQPVQGGNAPRVQPVAPAQQQAAPKRSWLIYPVEG